MPGISFGNSVMKNTILHTSKYAFDASAKTITFTEFQIHSHILLVANVTDNVFIYNFGCGDLGLGGSLSDNGNVLTLAYNTSAMSDTDDLQVTMYAALDESDIEAHRLLEIIRKQTEVQDEMLLELQSCSKYLKKIYNPE